MLLARATTGRSPAMNVPGVIISPRSARAVPGTNGFCYAVALAFATTSTATCGFNALSGHSRLVSFLVSFACVRETADLWSLRGPADHPRRLPSRLRLSCRLIHPRDTRVRRRSRWTSELALSARRPLVTYRPNSL
jgi:hypothetical protein